MENRSQSTGRPKQDVISSHRTNSFETLSSDTMPNANSFEALSLDTMPTAKFYQEFKMNQPTTKSIGYLSR